MTTGRSLKHGLDTRVSTFKMVADGIAEQQALSAVHYIRQRQGVNGLLDCLMCRAEKLGWKNPNDEADGS
jgi:hypothetical protein